MSELNSPKNLATTALKSKEVLKITPLPRGNPKPFRVEGEGLTSKIKIGTKMIIAYEV